MICRNPPFFCDLGPSRGRGRGVPCRDCRGRVRLLSHSMNSALPDCSPVDRPHPGELLRCLSGSNCTATDAILAVVHCSPRPPVPIDASRVSSMPAQGLSQSELIRTSVMYLPVPRHSALSHSTGPSPSARPFGSVRGSETFCSDLVQEYLAPIRPLAYHVG
jgi:hypothetical protein